MRRGGQPPSRNKNQMKCQSLKKYGTGKMDKRFTKDQIIKIVKEAEVTGNTREIRGRHHVMEQTF